MKKGKKIPFYLFHTIFFYNFAATKQILALFSTKMKYTAFIISLLTGLSLLPSCSSFSEQHSTLPEVSVAWPADVDYSRELTQVTLSVNDKQSALQTYKGLMAGRGNSTFNQPKKPYILKFAEPTPLLGLNAGTEFVVLANFYDHSLMRNALAYAIAKQTTLADVTVEGRFCQMSMNDENQGVYFITQSIFDLVADSLIELDAYRQRIQAYQGTPIDSIPSNLPIDTLSFIDWWIVQELCMNAEPRGPRSCYFRIHNNEKVLAGPVWDFDLAFNECGVDKRGDLKPIRYKQEDIEFQSFSVDSTMWLSIDSIYNDNVLGLDSLWENPTYKTKLRKRWHELKPRFQALNHYIDSCEHLIKKAAIADQQQWNIYDPSRYDNSYTFEEAMHLLRHNYNHRINAMDHYVGK